MTYKSDEQLEYEAGNEAEMIADEKSSEGFWNDEKLFEEVHNAWLKERLRRGDDLPSMVPYHKLPEDVKEFDRITTRTVLKRLETVFREQLRYELTQSEGFVAMVKNNKGKYIKIEELYKKIFGKEFEAKNEC